MKTIYILILMTILSCKTHSQSPIYPKYGNSNYGSEQGAYYKDINNIHSQYVGTWLYSLGNTSLKIVFRKRTMIHYQNPNTNSNFYDDDLVGEYQYIENGLEKINTLSNLNQEYTDSYKYNLCSRFSIPKNIYPKCNECADNERLLGFKFNEPSRRHLQISSTFKIRKFTENGVEKLKVWFVSDSNGIVYNTLTDDLSDINNYTLPFGEYILIKQP